MIVLTSEQFRKIQEQMEQLIRVVILHNERMNELETKLRGIEKS